VLFTEPFTINSYVPNYPPIDKAEVKILGQFSFRNTINYKWTGELFIRSVEKSPLIPDNISKFLHDCLYFY